MPGLYPTDQSRFPRPGTFNGPGTLGNPGTRAGFEGNYPRMYRSPGPSPVPRVNQTSQAQMQRAMLSKFAQIMAGRLGGSLLKSAAALAMLESNLERFGTPTNSSKFDKIFHDHVANGTHPEIEGYTYKGMYAPVPYPYSFWRWVKTSGPGWFNYTKWVDPYAWPGLYPGWPPVRPSLISLGFSGQEGGPYENYVYSKWWYSRDYASGDPSRVDGKYYPAYRAPAVRPAVGTQTYGHPWLRMVYPETIGVYEPQPAPQPMPYKDLPKRPDEGLGVGTRRGYGRQRPEIDRSPQNTVRRATQTNRDTAVVTQVSALRRPPKSREKQQKFIMGIPNASPLGVAIGLVTEGLDLVSALYRALPRDAKIHGRGFKTIQDKAAAVWNNFGRLFESPKAIGKTIEELVKSQVNDIGFGMIGKSIGQAQRNAFETTGQSVNGLNHLFSEIGKVGGQVSKLKVPKTGG